MAAKRKSCKNVGRILQDHAKVLAALRKARRDAILLHRKMGLPVVLAQGGKPILVDPNTLDL